MQLFVNLQNSITKNLSGNAFLINGIFYKYSDFAETISKIRRSIQTKTTDTEKNIGLVANDDIETYAAIIALWFEGKAYVPISPETPGERNENIIKQANLVTVIDSSEQPLFRHLNVIQSKKLPLTEIDLIPKEVPDEELAYIIFTSGTTGQPKGVPITRTNLTAFIDAFFQVGFDVDNKDRCLQMFELTFDFSVMCYLIPLMRGACLYTVPKDKIKYAFIYDLLDEQKLTFAGLVPSILSYLRPYFAEIKLPDMKYCIFSGEALSLDIAEQWSHCVPRAEIFNFYGPTEHTIFGTYYHYSRTSANKSHNGVLSIGKAMEGTQTIIIDENEHQLPNGEAGQLCLSGIQLTPGYWKDEEKTKEAFFYLYENGSKKRLYRTGDLCLTDSVGDLLYLGRIDFQTKIQGFRVELSEVEFHVKTFLEKINSVALAIRDAAGNTEIGLVIESGEFDTTALYEYMKIKMPAYMISKRIVFVDKFPLNANGKTDRKELQLLFKN